MANIVVSIANHLSQLVSNGEMEGLEFRVKAVALYGSRMTGKNRANSDLDVLIQYEGDAREDDLFNALNRQALFIEGVRIDFNPIKPEKSGTIATFAPNAVRIECEFTA